jgi:ribosome-binding protein aMBF1 (putative translation factor)
MNLKKYDINPDFFHLFQFENEKDELKHNTQMIMFRFLSEIEKLAESEGMNRKDLALAIGVSPSFLTQLYRGTKTLNLETIAKFEMYFKVNFMINAKPLEKKAKVRKVSITKISKSVHKPKQSGIKKVA